MVCIYWKWEHCIKLYKPEIKLNCRKHSSLSQTFALAVTYPDIFVYELHALSIALMETLRENLCVGIFLKPVWTIFNTNKVQSAR